MIRSMLSSVAPHAPQPAKAPWAAAAWALLGLVLAGGLVASVADLNRLGILLLVTVPLLMLVALNVEFGIYVTLGYATLLAFLIRMLPPENTGPIGIALDVLLVIMGARLLIDLGRKRDWKILSTPLTVPILTLVGFECVEVFNPAAPSLMFGMMGMRVTLRILCFFLVLYYFRSRQAIARLMWFWLMLMGGIGAYGIFQHHHGLLWQEMNWLLAEGNAQTHILSGYVRVFSTVGDASTFGFLMILSTLMCWALAIGSRGLKQVGLLLATLPMLYALMVTYSRGPIVGLVAGLGVMVLASRNLKLGLGAGTVAGLGLVLLVATGSSNFVDRLATAANPTEDASFMVRVGYIAAYVPEIAKRPFGYGVNASGQSGIKAGGTQNSRNSVAGVPTDNYYFKTALEMGWVGLILFLWVNFAALWQCYRAYRRAEDPFLKAVALGILANLFAVFVGAFSNDINSQKPLAEFFWVAIGLSMLIGQAQAKRAPGPLLLAAPRVLMLPGPAAGARHARPGSAAGGAA